MKNIVYRLFCTLLLLTCTSYSQAQTESFTVKSADGQALVRLQLSSQSTLPGTPITMSLTVLVSTWMSEAPVWPEMEVDNVMLRLPSDSSRSFSDTVDGKSWSGVTRDYLVYPMVAGDYLLPSQSIRVTYADPSTRAPIAVNIKTQDVSFRGVLPEALQSLDPFIGAKELRLEQSFTGSVDSTGGMETTVFKAGDAVTRKVVARIVGTSPVFIPEIITAPAQKGLAQYPKEPVLKERFSFVDGVSGSRTETLTYTFEQGGRYTLPAVTVRWFNLETKAVESAQLDEIVVVARTTLLQRIERHWKLIIGVLVVLSLLSWVVVTFFPRFFRRGQEAYLLLKQQYLESESYAFQQAKKAVNSKQLDPALKAINRWLSHVGLEQNPAAEDVKQALASIGEDHYAGRDGAETEFNWQTLSEVLEHTRNEVQRMSQQQKSLNTLPPLNPR